MKILYVALDPLKYPRIPKLSQSLREEADIQFVVMLPWMRLLWRRNRVSRLIASVLNYTSVTLQVLVSRADIFWVANCPDILSLPLIFTGRRYIAEYRSPWAVEIESEFGRGPWSSAASFLEVAFLRYAMAISLTTSALKGRVSRYHKPTFVIPNYPVRSFGDGVAPREQTMRETGCPPDSKVILFVGKLSRIEGADMIPEIAREVVAKDPKAVIWVIGDGPYLPNLKSATIDSGGRVMALGWKRHSEIASYIIAADVCVAPRHPSPYSSYYNEEGVTKLSEYMFFGKAIVACGMAKSTQYELVPEEQMANAILKGLSGKGMISRRMTWEDQSVPELKRLISFLRETSHL